MSNVQTLLCSAYKKLSKATINSAHLDAELLLSFVLSSRGGQAKSREYILAHQDKKLTAKQIAKFNNLIKQRAKNIPVAYLINKKEFYGREFYVDERVLVPRPESEMFVNEIKRDPISTAVEIGSLQKISIIDIGTGSGCIIITLAKELSQRHDVKFFATDISKDALTVARKNAKLHGVNKKIKFLQGNLLEPIYNLELRTYNLLLVANLPYLTPAQIKNSPSIKHEPKLALAAGKDGLKYYRELAKQIQKLIKQNSKIKITLLCEIDPAQVNGMKKIFSPKKIYPANCRRATIFCGVKKDLSGLNRVVVIKF